VHALASLASMEDEKAPCMQGVLQTFFPASVLASLSRLRQLELSNLGLEEVHHPLPWMACLTQLTRLQLGSNQFSGVPVSLTAIPQLEVLGLTCNPLLQLSSQDVETLLSIPCLGTLMLGKVAAVEFVAPGILHWSQRSVQAILELKELRPGLQVQV